ncbi:MAG: hypothetical protein CMN29_14675 [Sandaracinus sp.]|nr:hypothetical protein [Sandaracinus sp.]
MSCRPQVRATAPGGVLVLRGSGLAQTELVRMGSQTLAITRRSNQEVRARVPRSARGGPIRVTVGGTVHQCGTVNVVGTAR